MALARRRLGTAEKASAAPCSHYPPGNKRSELLPLQRFLAADSALVPAGPGAECEADQERRPHGDHDPRAGRLRLGRFVVDSLWCTLAARPVGF